MIKLLSFDSGVNNEKYLDLNPRQFVKLWLIIKICTPAPMAGACYDNLIYLIIDRFNESNSFRGSG